MRLIHLACIGLWTSLIVSKPDPLMIGLGAFFLANAVVSLLDEIMEIKK